MLSLCLERLKPGAQTLQASLYEVIVTDDGANNEAKELIASQYPWVLYVAGPKKGPAANRNNGAKPAKGKWLVFTDDDCLPDSNWLIEYHKATVEHPQSKAFEGAILPDNWKMLKKDMAECPVNDKGGCFWSANIMVEKDLFWRIEGFDEGFKIAAQEDQDLYLRLKSETSIPFIRVAFLEHPVRVTSLSKKLAGIPAMFKNWQYYIQKHHPDTWVLLLKKSKLLHQRLIIIHFLHFRFKKCYFHINCYFYNRTLVLEQGRVNEPHK